MNKTINVFTPPDPSIKELTSATEYYATKHEEYLIAKNDFEDKQKDLQEAKNRFNEARLNYYKVFQLDLD